MKKLALLFLVSMLPPLAGAQIEVSCRLIHGRVLQFEPVLVKVELANRSFHPLKLAGNQANALLTFDVEQGPGMLVPASDAMLPPQPVTIAPGGTWQGVLDILPAYTLRRTGPYSVTARLDWNEKSFISGKMFLDVLPGLEIHRIVSGVPGNDGATRTYSLRTLSRDRKEHLFLRVDDEEQSQCFGVIYLGTIVRMFTPVMQVDALGNMHVLHQSGPWQYARHIVTPDGQPISQETYVGEGGRVQMEAKPSGQVVVKGAEVYTGAGDGDEVPEPDADDEPEE